MTLAATHELKWLGTLRGRVGFLPTQRVLLYVTGGLAYGELESTYAFNSTAIGPIPLSISRTKAGWTVGGGIEAGLWSRWTAKVEYLYVDLGSFDNNGGFAGAVNLANTPGPGFNTVTSFTGATTTKFTDNIVRVGLNYNFGPGQGQF
jgi:outer membrane immunogenic protein